MAPRVSDRLSPRQLEVFLLIAQGKTDKQIAEALSCSVHTVRTHVRRALEETELRRTQVAARVYVEHLRGQGGSRDEPDCRLDRSGP